MGEPVYATMLEVRSQLPEAIATFGPAALSIEVHYKNPHLILLLIKFINEIGTT